MPDRVHRSQTGSQKLQAQALLHYHEEYTSEFFAVHLIRPYQPPRVSVLVHDVTACYGRTSVTGEFHISRLGRIRRGTGLSCSSSYPPFEPSDLELRAPVSTQRCCPVCLAICSCRGVNKIASLQSGLNEQQRVISLGVLSSRCPGPISVVRELSAV